ncbi:MAG: DNA polymerase III subunit epsilon [Hyphomicrobium sp.]
MREIILDTETTGLDPKSGDRLVEVGCVELLNRIPTGREFHRYINPERDVPAEAVAVHGLSGTFLEDKPLFAHVAEDFLDFIGEDSLIIHNASFDIGFLNAELGRISLPAITMDRVTCTLQLARRRHPAGPNNLDALCKRYGIDISKRTKHGALKDSLLLAEVYIELLGARQAALGLAMGAADGSEMGAARRRTVKQRSTPLESRLTAEAEAEHRAFVETLGANALWHRYLGAGIQRGK